MVKQYGRENGRYHLDEHIFRNVPCNRACNLMPVEQLSQRYGSIEHQDREKDAYNGVQDTEQNAQQDAEISCIRRDSQKISPCFP